MQLYPQKWQLKGLFPVCVAICCRNWDLKANFIGQKEHNKGLSVEWLRQWFSYSLKSLHRMSQFGHLNPLTFVICIGTLPFWYLNECSFLKNISSLYCCSVTNLVGSEPKREWSGTCRKHRSVGKLNKIYTLIK